VHQGEGTVSSMVSGIFQHLRPYLFGKNDINVSDSYVKS